MSKLVSQIINEAMKQIDAYEKPGLLDRIGGVFSPKDLRQKTTVEVPESEKTQQTVASHATDVQSTIAAKASKAAAEQVPDVAEHKDNIGSATKNLGKAVYSGIENMSGPVALATGAGLAYLAGKRSRQSQ